MPPGRPRRRRPWTMRRCATSSSTFIACWTRSRADPSTMGLVKRITRSRAVQETLGFLVAAYLKLVQRTNRFVMEPADAYDRIDMPVIAAMWHGQHFMIHFAKRPQDRAASLVSRSGDGEFNAI